MSVINTKIDKEYEKEDVKKEICKNDKNEQTKGGRKLIFKDFSKNK